MLEPVAFPTSSGLPSRGVLALPDGDGPVPAIIVIHEWWGLNDQIQALCRRFASEGFLALAVDLYDGQVTDSTESAMALVNDLKTPTAMTVIAGARDFLKSHPRCRGKVAVTGFCLGGAMALAAGCNVSGLSAILPFYGLPRPQYADWSRLEAPIQGHFASVDAHVPREKVLAALAQISATGAAIEVYFYDAGHAFMREGDPAAYDAAAATLAWERALAFLHRHLDA